MANFGRRYGMRKTVYPLFEQIASVATDTWWQKFILDCAKGSLPKGVSLNGMIISYAHMGELVNYELSEDLEQAYKELRSFFALHSKIDNGETTEKGTDTQSTSASTVRRSRTKQISIDKWSGVRSKNNKSALLVRYMDAATKEHGLSKEQRKSLENAIYYADLYNCLDDTTVQMENGMIVSISCVQFDGNMFHFIRPTAANIEPRIVRIPAPPKRLYSRYPAKQLDPTLLITKHLKVLRKQHKSGVIKKASGIVKEDPITDEPNSHDELGASEE